MLNNKNFPHMVARCNVNFVPVVTALNNTKNKENVTLHHMEKIFIS